LKPPDLQYKSAKYFTGFIGYFPVFQFKKPQIIWSEKAKIFSTSSNASKSLKLEKCPKISEIGANEV
jgi:hypothetical protein